MEKQRYIMIEFSGWIRIPEEEVIFRSVDSNKIMLGVDWEVGNDEFVLDDFIRLFDKAADKDIVDLKYWKEDQK